MKKKTLLAASCVLALSMQGTPDSAMWPAGPGQKLVLQNCLICHSGEIITSQRLKSETWLKEVNKMADWGSPIPEADKAVLVEYLSKHFSPSTPLPPAKLEKVSF